MKQQWLRMTSVLLVCTGLLACTTVPKTPVIDTPGKVFIWSHPITSKGTIDLYFTLSESSWGRITFEEGPASFILDNSNCLIGHQIQVTGQDKSNNLLFSYGKKEIPWNTSQKLRISWNKQQITFSINGEEFPMPLAKPIRSIQLLNFTNIEKFEYLPQ